MRGLTSNRNSIMIFMPEERVRGFIDDSQNSFNTQNGLFNLLSPLFRNCCVHRFFQVVSTQLPAYPGDDQRYKNVGYPVHRGIALLSGQYAE